MGDLYGWFSKLRSLCGYPKHRCRTIVGTQKGTIILTTTHMGLGLEGLGLVGFRACGV